MGAEHGWHLVQTQGKQSSVGAFPQGAVEIQFGISALRSSTHTRAGGPYFLLITSTTQIFLWQMRERGRHGTGP